jgi:NADH-quinone oxidoreductase subunit H
MRLCWKLLLPLSLANIFVTGVVYLAIDEAGPGMASTLQVLGDVSQAFVALVADYFVLRAIVGWFRPSKHKAWHVGSTAKLAAELGGTKRSPMQA